jgi:glutamyl-tRNA reductase
MNIQMQKNHTKFLQHFFIAGINYRKTDAALRGQFAISNDQYKEIQALAPDHGINEFFILSTCNRTEIYGYANDVQQLIKLLCTKTKASKQAFLNAAYIKNGKDAVEHLYNVAAGLDSQILGDYEIVGQIKSAAKIAKENGFISTSMERMLNAALQASKAVKNQTEISGGTVSVAFAAVQYIRQHIKKIADKKILLLGVGKIGRNTCKNVVDYLQTKNVTLINRSPEKAKLLAEELGLRFSTPDKLAEEVAAADIILLATNATTPILLKKHLENKGEKLIIDLSIPYNVDDSAQNLSNITLVNVDELAKMKDETLARRQTEVPKAKAIINKSINDLLNWYEMRKYVPVLTAVKIKLKEIHSSTHATCSTSTSVNLDDHIQRVLNGLSHKMRSQNKQGCNYIEALNEFLASDTN